jgi:hypothetical protein
MDTRVIAVISTRFAARSARRDVQGGRVIAAAPGSLLDPLVATCKVVA